MAWPRNRGTVSHRLGRMTVATAVLLVCGCSRAAPPPAFLADIGRAEALVHQGCYHCLEEALGVFDRLAAGRPTNPAAARGAFTAAVLLALRARELGLPSDAHTQAARDRAAQLPLPAAMPVYLPAQVVLDAVALVDGETSGLPPEQREQRNRWRRAAWPDDGTRPAARLALSPALRTDPLAQYVALAIDCEDARARKAVDHRDVLARYPQPLLRFRVALCGVPGMPLDRLRQEDPRWVDTLFFEGRAAITRFPAPDVGQAVELFALAHDAFQESVAITLALGNAENALDEYAAALTRFDSILTAAPTHRDALLGRLLSLSYLRRHYDAIRTAGDMVDLGTYHMGDAYYWRAWNRYQVHELARAWSDVELAGTLMVNTAVYTLAGFIAYAQRDLDTAIDRLDRAYRLDNTNCEAVWTEGMVHVDQATWELASARFTTAVACFTADARAARDAIADTDKAAWSDAVKARRIATAQKRADSSEHRRAQAAFNAASSYLRLARKADAMGYAEMAATHPLLRDKAIALRAAIEKLH